ATLAPDMADREIGMDPREGTSRSPSVPLVPASPTPIKARGDAVPPASPIPLVPEEATNIRPPVPI
ncbi:hypothetical protein H5410_022851, partial [Solanum commersonii]